MASKTNALVAKIALDITEWSNKINKVVLDSQKASREIDRQFKGLTQIGNSMAGVGQKLALGITAPLLGIAAASVKSAAGMESTNIAFATMLKSGDKAKSLLSDLTRFAANTPFEFNELTSASRRMLALGFSAKEIIPVLTNVGNASSALGLGSAGIDRITTALGQMRLKGKASSEEMMQLTEAGINSWSALAKALNTDVATAMARVQKGLVDGKFAAQAILDDMGKTFAGGMEAQSKTLQGKWSNIMDSLKTSAVSVGETLITTFDVAGKLESLQAAVDAFKQLPAPAKELSVYTALVAGAIPIIVTGVGKWLTSLKEIVKAMSWLAGKGVFGALEKLFIPAAVGAGILKFGDMLMEHGAKPADKTRESLERLNKEMRKTGATANINWGKSGPSALAGKESEYDTLLNFSRSTKAQSSSAPAPKTKSGAASGTKQNRLATLSELVDAEINDRSQAGLRQLVSVMADASMASEGYGRKIEYVKSAVQSYLNLSPELIDALLYTAERGREVGRANQTIADSFGQINAALKPFNDVKEAFRDLGIVTDNELNAKVEKLNDLYLKAAKTGIYTGRDLIKVEYELLRAKEATGQLSSVELQRLQQLKMTVEGYSRSVADAADKSGSLATEISTIITNMNQGIADSIVQWRGFGDMAIGIVRNIGKAIVADLLQRFVLTQDRLKAVSDSLAGIFTNAKRASSIANKAGSTVSTVAGGAGDAAGAASSTASAAKIATSTLMSTVGAIGNVASAVSSIVGNFQMAGMNKTLDLQERELRIIRSLIESNVHQINTYLPELANIRGIFQQMLANGLGVFSQANTELRVSGAGGIAGGGGLTLNIYAQTSDPAEMADALYRQLKLKGLV